MSYTALGMIYADCNATTPLGDGAKLKIHKAMERWGNPSSSHAVGRYANELLEEARNYVAQVSHAEPRNIVFTSGGSEANTLALLGSFYRKQSGFKLLTSKIEHSSVIGTVGLLSQLGAIIEYVDLLPSGALNLERFEQRLNAFKPDLVSLMTANNETGILFPIPEVNRICERVGIVLHTDAVQAFGKLDPSFWNKAPLISLSAHKIYGPKGVGALLVSPRLQLVSTHYGGSQEMNRRGGTQNMMGIAGFGGACLELSDRGDLNSIEPLRNRFEERILSQLDGVVIQGRETSRIPNTTHVRFCGIAADILLTALDLEGVCVSAGSACSSGTISPSQVLIAMGLTPEQAKEGLRFSWGRMTTHDEIDSTASLVINHVNRIRDRRKQ